MDEEKKIMEKRSSFRGWRERNKGKASQKRNIIGTVIVVSIFFILILTPYSKVDDNPIGQQNDTLSEDMKTNSSNSSSKTANTVQTATPVHTKTIVPTPTPKKIAVGKIGIPLITNGLEITVERVTPLSLYTSVWVSVRNLENKEHPFKLSSGTILIDNIGQQYEDIKVTRSGEISQTDLYAKAMREGAIFFESLKEGRKPERLVLNINGEKVEFILKR